MIKYKKIIYSSIVLSSLILIFLIEISQEKDVTKNNINDAVPNISNRISDLKLTVPVNWKQIEPQSSMRHSEYKIANRNGEFNLIVFKNIGGSIDQNITRWINQFSGNQHEKMPLISKEIERNGKNFTFLQNSGIFNGGMGQSKEFENAALIGFIVQDTRNTYYFKAVADVDILFESKEEIIDTILRSAL